MTAACHRPPAEAQGKNNMGPGQGFFIWPARPNEKAFEILNGRFRIEPDVRRAGGFK
jgi:hypothetical protein